MSFSQKISNAFFTFRAMSKWKIKFFFVLIALSIVVSVILYTQMLVDELIEREQQAITVYTKIFSRITQAEDNNVDEYFFFIETVTPTITFPIIIADENDQPIEDYEAFTRNVDLDFSLPYDQQKILLTEMIVEMGQSYPPILLNDNDGNVVQKFYYTNSNLINKLRFFPYIEIAILATFIFIGYAAFSFIRKNEETKVWVGMAKEAAHQLGTPLSSLLAWIEILKYSKDEPEAILDTVGEMESDIAKLNTIATRFSKIGSKPEQKILELSEEIEKVCLYFEKRLPHLGRRVELVRKLDFKSKAAINNELFQWVIENLLKNAAESIEIKEGKVEITVFTDKKKVRIQIKDNGKGMTNKLKRQVFFPGFTTKRRGWGLGLSLCKRIIEQYHNGKIYIKESQVGVGTTFMIELPRVNNS
jgi:Histidine kinase-, DNA gyrase B-, and HSP90-like ATPase